METPQKTENGKRLREGERSLRSWLKATWRGPLFWIEPGRGGSVGLPDALLVHRSKLYPVELKVGVRSHRGIFARLRPAQIRFHQVCVKHGISSAFLINVDGDVYFLAGKYGTARLCTVERHMVCLTAETKHSEIFLAALLEENKCG